MNYTALKFKMLADGYPSFSFPASLLEEVDLSTFLRAEEQRLPLFVGTQFGLYPNKLSLELFKGLKIAILYKSQLSGVQVGISIYEVRQGKRLEIRKIPLERPFWNHQDLKKFQSHEAQDQAEELEVPDFLLPKLSSYLELTGSEYRGRSLLKIYEEVTSSAYGEYLLFSYRNPGVDWIGYLGTDEGVLFLELYRFLDISLKRNRKSGKELPIALERQLDIFRSIRNPYRRRSGKFLEVAGKQDLLVLSDLALCIIYNNHINIYSYEADLLQEEILQELERRGFYMKNTYLMRNHANPIEIEVDNGIPLVTVHGKLPFRSGKDIAPFETGPAKPQLIYERYYGLYNSLSDIQLVEAFNSAVGVRAWGVSRAAVIRALRSQLKKRGLDTSSVESETSFSLSQCVVLDNRKLLRLGELPEERLLPILLGYLRNCYPELETTGLRIIRKELEKLSFCISGSRLHYALPINDLLKRKGEMRSITPETN